MNFKKKSLIAITTLCLMFGTLDTTNVELSAASRCTTKTVRYSNRKVKTKTTCRNGNKVISRYNTRGRITSKTTYKSNRKNNTIYYKSGKISSRKYYNTNGNTKSITYYKAGKKNNTIYYKSGKISSRKYYYSNGSTKSIINYKNGKANTIRRYTTSGKSTLYPVGNYFYVSNSSARHSLKIDTNQNATLAWGSSTIDRRDWTQCTYKVKPDSTLKVFEGEVGYKLVPTGTSNNSYCTSTTELVYVKNKELLYFYYQQDYYKNFGYFA